MKEYKFATSVAFIPHNYRRSCKGTAEMFRVNSDRLAICFHGNDHTAGEFASSDSCRLNTALRIAEARMSVHAHATGLRCPKVMVFPQDDFSVEALRVLKSRSFLAAVCGMPRPVGSAVNPSLRELAQPAFLRYGGFPLFRRMKVEHVRKENIAFSLFFGMPAFIAAHHDDFKRPAALIEAISTINVIAPGIQWCSLETAIIKSALTRKTSDGAYRVRAYSGAVRLANCGESMRRFVVEWNHSPVCPAVDGVRRDSAPVDTFEVDDTTIRLSVQLTPRSSHTFSVAYRNDYSSLDGLGLLWRAKAVIRRRLSEARDNYLSKNQFSMAVAQDLRRRVFSKIL
jgi:hypothetical protein